jgi:hypothetical protein
VSSRVLRSNLQTKITEIEGRSFSDLSSDLCSATGHQILTSFCKYLLQRSPIISSHFTAPENHLEAGRGLGDHYQTYYIPFAGFDLLSRSRSSSCKVDNLTSDNFVNYPSANACFILTRQFSRQPRDFIYSIISSISCLPIYYPSFLQQQTHSPIETPSSAREMISCVREALK